MLIGYDYMAVAELMADVARCLSREPTDWGYLSKLEVLSEKKDDRPADNRAKYFTVDGEVLVFSKPDRVHKVTGKVVLWWRSNGRTLVATLKYLNAEYKVIASDTFRYSSRFLQVWRIPPDQQVTREIMVDTIDRAGMQLVWDMARFRMVADNHLSTMVEVLLKNGDHHSGSFNGVLGETIIMDIGYRTIGVKFADIEAMWTKPSQKDTSSE